MWPTLLDADQLWVDGPWAAQLGLDPDPGNTGYGHSARGGRDRAAGGA